jgi:hypothetical protein
MSIPVVPIICEEKVDLVNLIIKQLLPTPESPSMSNFIVSFELGSACTAAAIYLNSVSLVVRLGNYWLAKCFGGVMKEVFEEVEENRYITCP